MVEGLFEMLRSGEEAKVQELLAMIRENASMGSIAAKIEAGMKAPEGSQKRKRSVSSSALSKEGMSAEDQTGSEDQTERHNKRPPTGSIGPKRATSRSAPRPAPRRVTSPNDSLGVTGLTLASDDHSYPIIDLAQVGAFVGGLARVALFSH
jgi:hypothetical protein